MSWIQLFGGGEYDFNAPYLSPRIKVTTIAHSLARLCRFNGHTRDFYSVAEHSVRCSHLVEPELALVALLHDAHEALVGDVTSPLKRMIPGFETLDSQAKRFVSLSLGVEIFDLPPAVKWADLVMLATEKRDLLDDGGRDWGMKLPPPMPETIEPWGIQRAEALFLERYQELAHGMPCGKEQACA